jgi:hypothetical protein
MSNTSKMDVSTIFEMFEKINEKLDKRTEKPVAPTQIDLSAENTLTEKIETVIKEVRKPSNVEHQHRHMIDINSSKVFLSLVVMVLMILGLSYAVGEQRRNISQYRNNDLKYRYIKMLGQTNSEDLYRLEQQFRYGDSIRIIRNQVEKYEELVKEQSESIARARRNEQEIVKFKEKTKDRQ